MNDRLIQVKPNGTLTYIDNDGAAISRAVGAPFDFVSDRAEIGFYIDDEGLLNGSLFNATASMMIGRALYGNCVLVSGSTDDEGNTLPPTDDIVHFAKSLASLWHAVVVDAEQAGQDVMPPSNEATVPPATITSFDNDEDFFRAMGWGDEAIDGMHRTEDI